MGYDSLIGVPISNNVMRYIVPFSYVRDRDENTESYKEKSSYEHACEKLREQIACKTTEAGKEIHKWNLEQGLKKNDKMVQSECYDYLNDLYARKDDELGKSNTVGSIWKLNSNDAMLKVFDDLVIEYVLEDKKSNNLEKESVKFLVKIVDAGLYLLKNNIGLFWYEVEFQETHPTIDELVDFQYVFKELSGQARKNIRLFYNGSCRIPKNESCSKNLDEEILEVLKERYQSDNWINDFSYANYEYIVKSELKDGSKQVEYKIPLTINKLGVCINDLISDIDCQIHYYPSRKHEKVIDIPDKALLFNYIVVDEKKLTPWDKSGTLKYAAYYLTKGFKKSYKPPVGFDKEMLYPFENELWYAQKEGFGIYVSYSEDNKDFFGGSGKANRVRRDYFHLYMSLLQQSFILLKYAEEVAYSISANKHEYENVQEDVNYNLLDLQRRINLFLMKNVCASVAFTNHHNRLYAYIEKTLNIKEDIAALNSGMKALDELLCRQKEEIEREEKEYNEEKDLRVQRSLTILSVISALSIPTIICEFVGIDFEKTNLVANMIRDIFAKHASTDITIFVFEIAVYAVSVILFIMLFIKSWPILKELFSKDSRDKKRR